MNYLSPAATTLNASSAVRGLSQMNTGVVAGPNAMIDPMSNAAFQSQPLNNARLAAQNETENLGSQQYQRIAGSTEQAKENINASADLEAKVKQFKNERVAEAMEAMGQNLFSQTLTNVDKGPLYAKLAAGAAQSKGVSPDLAQVEQGMRGLVDPSKIGPILMQGRLG